MFGFAAAAPCGAEIVQVSPVGGETVAMIPEAQKKAMSLPTLADRIKLFKDDEAGDKTLRRDKTWRKAAPLLLKWRTTSGEKGPWKIEIGKEPDLSDARAWYVQANEIDPVTGREIEKKSGETTGVFSRQIARANLESNREYFWRVTTRGRCGMFCGPNHDCGKNANVVRSGISSFRTEDAAPRWIALEGEVGNVRDLGGWRAAGGRRVRQGMIYRGQGLNENSVTGERRGRCRLTVEDRDYLAGTLGIRTDLDLRTPGETADMEESPLGRGVKLVRSSSPFYRGIFLKNGAPDRLHGTMATMAENFRVFCRRENYPVYVHCIGGSDRTGSLAYILLGVLGVDRHDMEVDWESTFYPKIPDANPDPNFWCRESHFNEGLSKYGEEGDSWTRRIELYLLDCGVTEDEIAAFRAIMLE